MLPALPMYSGCHIPIFCPASLLPYSVCQPAGHHGAASLRPQPPGTTEPTPVRQQRAATDGTPSGGAAGQGGESRGRGGVDCGGIANQGRGRYTAIMIKGVWAVGSSKCRVGRMAGREGGQVRCAPSDHSVYMMCV